MGLLSKIGKGLKKVVKKAGKVIGGVAQIAAPIVSMVPGIGTAVGAGLSIVGGLLGPKEKAPKEVAPVTTNMVGPVQKLVPSAPSTTVASSPAAPIPMAALAIAALAFFVLKGR
jgi:hypothetical protein